MTPSSLDGWLRCPTCHADLASVDEGTLGCAAGHRFDRNKHGYLTVLPQARRHTADDASMLDARRLVLESGLYDPILRAVASIVPDGDVFRIADLGCGTGHYLEAVLDELRRRDRARSRSTARAHVPGRRALACDLSPQAVRRTLRLLADPPAKDRGRSGGGVAVPPTASAFAEAGPAAGPHIVGGLVADIWAPSPLRDGAADLLLNIFAPRNLPEFGRVLSAGGSLISVVPAGQHFRELTESGLALHVPAGKADRLVAEAERTGLFRSIDRAHVTRTIHPPEGLRAALTAMGPAARHHEAAPRADASDGPPDASPRPSTGRIAGDTGGPVTISVDVLRFLRI